PPIPPIRLATCPVPASPPDGTGGAGADVLIATGRQREAVGPGRPRVGAGARFRPVAPSRSTGRRPRTSAGPWAQAGGRGRKIITRSCQVRAPHDRDAPTRYEPDAPARACPTGSAGRNALAGASGSDPEAVTRAQPRRSALWLSRPRAVERGAAISP